MDQKIKNRIVNAARDLFPPLIWRAVVRLKNRVKKPAAKTYEPDPVLKKNIDLKDKFKGRRIFILGTGPSVKEQNLLPLSHELCIGLNEFNLHPDFNTIKPAYMIFSGFSLHPDISGKALEWYKRYEQHIQGTSVAILNLGDKAFLEQHHLLKNTEKYFVNYIRNFDELEQLGFHPEEFSYLSQNVSVMALQMALYMGASEIYLLGCDHDWILTALENRQNHFYDDEQSIIYTDQSKEFKSNIFKDFLQPYYYLFQQYGKINEYVIRNGQSKIYNASKRSLLDVFERKNLEDVVK